MRMLALNATRVGCIYLCALLSAAIPIAQATDAPATSDQAAHPGQTSEPSRETRDKLATLHEQMAACLRSDKSFSECHAQMQKACQASLGKQGCPRMRMGSHMGRQSMMMPSPAPGSTTQH
jgi:hypothetical protein